MVGQQQHRPLPSPALDQSERHKFGLVSGYICSGIVLLTGGAKPRGMLCNQEATVVA
jgi:hypothetical protein